MLEIKNLCVRAANKDILRGIDLMVTAGEVHARAVFNGKTPSTWENSPPSQRARVSHSSQVRHPFVAHAACRA